MPRRVRIVHVNLVFERADDGAALAARYATLRRLAEAQAARGADVHVVQRFSRDEAFEAGGVRWTFHADAPSRFVPSPLFAARGLARHVARMRPDVVQLGGLEFPAATAALRHALPRRAALVVQDHGSRPRRSRRLLVQRLGLPRADAFLFTDAAMAEPWRAFGAIPAGAPVFGVPEASSDFEPVDREPARRATGVDGDPAVLWVGRLHVAKDPLLALSAFGRFLDARPGARLHVVFAEDPLRPAVDGLLAARPRLAARVRLVGRLPHEELPAWYAAADLFLTTSAWEGSNYALLEALACGLPAIASANPANRHLVERVAGGVLAPVGDEVATATALVDASSRSDLLGPAARRALRGRFVESLSWDAVARLSLAAYETALAARARRVS